MIVGLRLKWSYHTLSSGSACTFDLTTLMVTRTAVETRRVSSSQFSITCLADCDDHGSVMKRAVNGTSRNLQCLGKAPTLQNNFCQFCRTIGAALRIIANKTTSQFWSLQTSVPILTALVMIMSAVPGPGAWWRCEQCERTFHHAHSLHHGPVRAGLPTAITRQFLKVAAPRTRPDMRGPRLLSHRQKQICQPVRLQN